MDARESHGVHVLQYFEIDAQVLVPCSSFRKGHGPARETADLQHNLRNAPSLMVHTVAVGVLMAPPLTHSSANAMVDNN
jgi:hypothetical protein